MQSTTRPLTSKEVAELRGYIWWPIALFRAVLFLTAVGAFGTILRAFQRVFSPSSVFAHPAWWIAPAAAFAVALYVVSGRWTGGRALRKKIRADLKGGIAAVHRITAVEAIEIEEEEDEGPSFFLRTDDGRTVVFSGQDLGRYKRRGFPWKAFEVSETPRARVFLSIRHDGERLVPSLRRPGLTGEQTKRLRMLEGKYVFLDVDFATLKRELADVPPDSRANKTRRSPV